MRSECLMPGFGRCEGKRSELASLKLDEHYSRVALTTLRRESLAILSDAEAGRRGRRAKDCAKLIAHRRTLLVLDGLEPLQNPPGPQEGRLRDPSLQALLRELAALNKGAFCDYLTDAGR